MRRFIPALALPLALLAARSASAADKLAYVDVERAIAETEEGKAAKVHLQGELEAKRDELKKMEDGLQKLKVDYDRQAGVLSDDAKQAKQKEMQAEFGKYEHAARESQVKLQQKEAQTFGGIGEKMLVVVQEVADKAGFNFVVNKKVLLYAPTASDITNEVVREYNKRHGSGRRAKKQAQAPKNDQ